jgi:hypothetical protein
MSNHSLDKHQQLELESIVSNLSTSVQAVLDVTMDRVLDVKDVVPILGRDVLVVISKVVDV